jgi:hypothetical protein
VPVLATVVGNVMVAALGAARHMAAERFSSAGLNRPLSWFASKPLTGSGHHLELGEADMPYIGLPPRRTMGTEDVSDLQLWPGHYPAALLLPSA